jgi:hypothetical protein
LALISWAIILARFFSLILSHVSVGLGVGILSPNPPER